METVSLQDKYSAFKTATIKGFSKPITYKEVSDMAIIEGDIVLGKVSDIASFHVVFSGKEYSLLQ